MRASKSATGSVKLIFVYLLLSSPVSSGSTGEPAVTYCKPALGSWYLALSGRLSFSTNFNLLPVCQIPTTKYQLPGTFRYPRNLTLQRQAAETQAAEAELAQKSARPSADAAAIA